ncbi:hypothetical protein RRG08_057045 [Elysia crispata]|uniref:Uncharacterized protein n=1 Tax=Elysia crispata TaxID=231223 RepID=A0AAE0Z6I3_9GAST|nr:hypothetical protein RRG08_057045 [Elysia crispata]
MGKKRKRVIGNIIWSKKAYPKDAEETHTRATRILVYLDTWLERLRFWSTQTHGWSHQNPSLPRHMVRATKILVYSDTWLEPPES